jgi:hypothetical protein
MRISLKRIALRACVLLVVVLGLPKRCRSQPPGDFDVYGGISAVRCAKGPAPHFYTEKIGDRWWLCDPAGNGFFMKGLVGVATINPQQANVDTPAGACYGVGQPAPCCTGVGTGPTCGGKYYTGVNNPYIISSAQGPKSFIFNWVIEQINRMKLWGFNMVADASYAMVRPTTVDSRWNTSDYTIPEQFRMPFDLQKATTLYAFTNQAGCNLSSPIKDMLAGLTAANKSLVYYDFGDYFDPNYATCVSGQANPANDAALKAATQNPHNDYLVYITLDEGDQTGGFNSAGPDFPTVTQNGVPNNAHFSSHAGWITLNTSPSQDSNPKWRVATYSDHEVYSKVKLADMLASEYFCAGAGTPAACCAARGSGACSVDPASPSYIGRVGMEKATAALNAAWGSRYTTLSTSDPNCTTNLAACLQGGTYATWGTGTGLLDENGSCPAASGGACWVGNNITLAGESAAMQSDLNAYLYAFSVQYYRTLTGAFRTYEPGVLLQMTVGGWGAPPRKEVLQAAGQYLDIVQESFAPVFVPCPTCTDIQQRIDFAVRHLGDVPMMMWEGAHANPDSSVSQNAAIDIAPTQEGRGAAYQQIVTNLLNARDSNGTYHVIGFYWWDEFDMNGEGLNWGLVSLYDNPYDGCSATVGGCGLDQWGYSTGGEAGNYGDMLTDVTKANNDVLANMPP